MRNLVDEQRVRLHEDAWPSTDNASSLRSWRVRAKPSGRRLLSRATTPTERLIYGIVAAFAIILVVGLLALPVVAVAWFVLVIVASVAASHGEDYRYPFTIRFIN